MKKKAIEFIASVAITRQGSSKVVKIGWCKRKHREGDVWVIVTSRIFKRKRVAAPVILITDDTIQLLLETIHRMRTLGQFKTIEEDKPDLGKGGEGK